MSTQAENGSSISANGMDNVPLSMYDSGHDGAVADQVSPRQESNIRPSISTPTNSDWGGNSLSDAQNRTKKQRKQWTGGIKFLKTWFWFHWPIMCSLSHLSPNHLLNVRHKSSDFQLSWPSEVRRLIFNHPFLLNKTSLYFLRLIFYVLWITLVES